jgi:hypothetical protein
MELDTTSPPDLPPTDARTRGKLPASDGRSWQALFRKRIRMGLLKQIGGTPCTTQLCIIDAATEIGLELEVMKRRRDERGGLSLHDTRAFLAYTNAYRRHLVALGLKEAPRRPASLQEHLAGQRQAAQ